MELGTRIHGPSLDQRLAAHAVPRSRVGDHDGIVYGIIAAAARPLSEHAQGWEVRALRCRRDDALRPCLVLVAIGAIVTGLVGTLYPATSGRLQSQPGQFPYE